MQQVLIIRNYHYSLRNKLVLNSYMFQPTAWPLSGISNRKFRYISSTKL